MRYPDAPSVSEVELVIEIVLFVAVSGELIATAPPNNAIGPAIVVAEPMVIPEVLPALPRVNPEIPAPKVRFALVVKALEKLAAFGCKVRVPVVSTLVANPEDSAATVNTSPVNTTLAVLLVIAVPALAPNRAPELSVLIPSVPPFTVIVPEVAKIS